MKPASWLVLAALAAWPRPTAAHIQLTSPPARTTEQKKGPCGNGGGARSDRVTVLQPGQKIIVEWDETVEHPGHFRISFDDEGDDDFAVPASFDEACSNDKVLVDLIPDRKTSSGDRHYRQEVTLPNFECERCTLQVTQLMTDKAPYDASATSNDIYYQCADVALRGRPSSAVEPLACLIAGEAGNAAGAAGASPSAGAAGASAGTAGASAGTAGASAGAAGAPGAAPSAAVTGENESDDGCAFAAPQRRPARACALVTLAGGLATLVARRRARAAGLARR